MSFDSQRRFYLIHCNGDHGKANNNLAVPMRNHNQILNNHSYVVLNQYCFDHDKGDINIECVVQKFECNLLRKWCPELIQFVNQA